MKDQMSSLLAESSELIRVCRLTSQYITFDVSKSWKNVNTKIVAIRTDDGTSCGSFPFRQSQEYLVYGTKGLSSVDVTLCGGSTSIEHSTNELTFLENNYAPLELREGHTMSVNILSIMTIIGIFVAISIAAFAIIRRRA
jgi:hypothetical protein